MWNIILCPRNHMEDDNFLQPKYDALTGSIQFLLAVSGINLFLNIFLMVVKGLRKLSKSNPIQIRLYIVLNLHLLTDSKALDPSRIQSRSPLTICLTAVGRNRSTRRKPTLKSRSGTIPHIPVEVYWWNPHTYITMIY